MLAVRKSLYQGKVRSSVCIVIAALLSTLVFGTLLARQFDVIWPPRTWLAFVGDNTSVQSENRFLLHPQNHVFRNATTLTYEWRITAASRRPDGVLKEVFLINNQFPGPTIETRSGDRVVVHVTNALEDAGLSIHWHGLNMRGSNDMDGAAGVTQAAIEPGSSFTYDFDIGLDQKGTFWYHAHDGVQRADGLYGGLIVHEPRTNDTHAEVDPEHLLLVGDWYHRSAREALDFYMHPGAFGLETVPDSLLLNGAGTFECADAVPAFPVDCIRQQGGDLQMVQFDWRKRNIVRIVNVGAYAGFSVSSDDAHFTPLKVDGGFAIAGAPARSVGILHPGERMDLLVHSIRAEQPSHGILESSLTIALDTGAFKYQNPALSATHRFLVSWYGDSPLEPDAVVDVSERFDIQTAKPLPDEKPHLPPKADRTIVLYTITQKLAHLDNEPHGFINHTTWSQQASPLVTTPREQWDNNQFVPLIKYKENSPIWVDIVLNNLDEDSHPFHLHGHSFWVLSKYTSASNWGSYNPFEDADPPGGKYDLSGALQKDTVCVPRRGYAVIRFRADNEGLWMFHCHVLWHQASGMAMVLQVGR